jgi:hypothetical protein
VVNDPVLLIEVLSDSTEKEDPKEKEYFYQEIPTLQAYMLPATTCLQLPPRGRAVIWINLNKINNLPGSLCREIANNRD